MPSPNTNVISKQSSYPSGVGGLMAFGTGGLILLCLGLVALFFAILSGNYYITQIAFKAKRENGVLNYEISDAQYQLLRISAVCMWISLGIGIIGGRAVAKKD